MANELTTLTKTKKDLMRGLHLAYGFNFEKPYRVAKVCGSTTIKALKKSVCADKDDIVVALVPLTAIDTTMAAVELSPYYSQGFDVDGGRKAIHSNGITIYNAFDYFYYKKDFTDRRTDPRINIIVIAQSRTLTFRYTDPEECKARLNNTAPFRDKGSRYKILASEEWDHWTSYIIRKCDGKAQKGSISVSKSGDESLTDYLDKSGYDVRLYRADLKRRVDEYKAEIKRQEVLRMDYSDRVVTLREIIKAKRETLADALRVADTLKALEKVRDDLSYWDGLLDIMRDFEKFAEDVENKSFTSTRACDALYNRILNKAFNGRQ